MRRRPSRTRSSSIPVPPGGAWRWPLSALLLSSSLACSEYGLHDENDAVDGTEDGDAAPRIQVTPEAVDLGTLSPGDVISTVVTIRNLGEADLVLTDVYLEGGAPWTLTMSDSSAIPAGEDTRAVVEFTAAALGRSDDSLGIHSNDPEDPRLAVPLTAQVLDAEAGILAISPTFHDFGSVSLGDTHSTTFQVQNIGSASLTVDSLEFSASSTELGLPSPPSLPWTLGPGEAQDVVIDYTPADETEDDGLLTAQATDGQTAEAQVLGQGRAFSSFSTGWYVWDPRVPVPTTDNASYTVDHYGDEDSYFYEPSGAHGMTATTDLTADFATLRDYIISNAGAPIVPEGPFSWSEKSTVAKFSEATFTYFLCDFYLPVDHDPSDYTIETGSVDDGIRVIVNGHILGHLKLGDTAGIWTLDQAVPGTVNTLVIILVDQAAVQKYLYELGFWHEGSLVEG